LAEQILFEYNIREPSINGIQAYKSLEKVADPRIFRLLGGLKFLNQKEHRCSYWTLIIYI
jgi:hypothetical protein